MFIRMEMSQDLQGIIGTMQTVLITYSVLPMHTVAAMPTVMTLPTAIKVHTTITAHTVLVLAFATPFRYLAENMCFHFLEVWGRPLWAHQTNFELVFGFCFELSRRPSVLGTLADSRTLFIYTNVSKLWSWQLPASWVPNVWFEM